MTTGQRCRTCGGLLNESTASGGLCVRCMLQSGLAAEIEPEEASQRHLVLPHGFGPYELIEELGRGGMGVVYAARQCALDRTVAVKLLLSGAYASETALQRFRTEAAAAAGLQHPNIVEIHDYGEVEGQPYYAMDLVSGRNLAEVCDGRPLSAMRAANILRELADAVHYAHGKGILHRDLKPSNVLLDERDRPRVTDFGLARRIDAEGGVTLSGQMVGSPSYASPEQAAGRSADVGVASDIYGLGALFYHLLTGRAPFNAATPTDTLRLVLETDPPPPRLLNPALPRDLETICLKCLAKEPARRYATAAEVREDIDRFLQNRPIRARPPSVVYVVKKVIRRHRVGVLAGIGIVLALAIGAVEAFRAYHAERRQTELHQIAEQARVRETAALSAAAEQHQRDARIRWARDTALPEINRLIERDDFFAAFQLACQAEECIPEDPALTALWPQIAATVSIETVSVGSDTEPSPVTGADISFKPYRKPDADWQLLGKSPLVDVRVGRDVYRWQIKKDGYAPLEQAAGWYIFYWDANASKLTFQLEAVGARPPGMVRVERRNMSPANAPQLPSGSLDDFWIDRYEVTNRAYKEFVDGGGYATPGYWKHEFVQEGRVLTWNEASAMMRDRSGQTGPATWIDGTYAEGEAEHPVTGLSWYEAAAYAAFAGKRLPSIYHWQNAACVTHGAFLVPLSNFSGQGPAAVGSHQGMSRFGAYDMAGNAGEWCSNDAGDGKRYILGGGWRDPEYMFPALHAKPPFDRSPLNGFRCIQLKPGDALPPLVDALYRTALLRVYAQEKPISDEEFNNFRPWFVYDRTDLHARTEAVDDTDDRWRKETVSFDAAYSDERILALVFLPKRETPPYQAVVYFPGIWAQWWRKIGQPNAVDSALVAGCVASGRAVIYPVFKGSYERRFTAEEQVGRMGFRDWNVQLVKDVGRAIDYLDTRADMQTDQIAYCGYSWGANMGVIVSAIEPRIKVNVLVVGGLHGAGIATAVSNLASGHPLPEADPINFAPRVTIPTLMLNGRYDPIFPLETSQRPMFQWLGTAAEHKRHVIYDTGHDVPMKQVDAEIRAWLDRYLGAVRSE